MSRIAVNRLLNIITVIVAGSWTTCSSIRSYDSPKPALITSLDAQLHQEPRIDSTVIKKLRRGTVLYAMAETRSLQEVAAVGTDKWLRVKTRSNSEGWCFGKYLEFCTAQKAEVELQRDKLAFEIRLRKLILRAAEEKIGSSSIHPQSVIQSIVITSPLTPPSQSSSYSEVDVTALMVGSFLGVNKFRIDMKVRLAMQPTRLLERFGGKCERSAGHGQQTDGGSHAFGDLFSPKIANQSPLTLLRIAE